MSDTADSTGTPAGDPADDPSKGTPKTDPADKGKAPKFEGEFDADRASRLVENLRADVSKRDDELKTLRAQIESQSGNEKTLLERLSALETKSAQAEHSLLVAKVAKEHSVPDDLLEFLTGKEEATLKTQAERLASYASKRPADDVPGKPKPKLTPGHGGDPEDEFDPDKVAKAARRR